MRRKPASGGLRLCETTDPLSAAADPDEVISVIEVAKS
jgi:hypothetical protein